MSDFISKVCESIDKMGLAPYDDLEAEMTDKTIKGNESWLIKNSTKEERQKRLNDALAISMLDAKAPEPKAMELYQKYIDGEMELDEIKDKLIEMYTEIE